MSNRQSKRRTTAVLTAVLLLFCQVAFAAQACASHLTAAVEAAVAPCHHAAESDGSTPPTGAARSGCEAPALASEGVNLPVTLAAALPAPPHNILVPFAAQTWHPPTLAGLTHCHSPPLTILHCRLLN